MDNEAFQEQMELLDDRFRPKPTLSRVLKAYWRALRELPNLPFKEVINEIIISNKYYPTPGEILTGWGRWVERHPGYMENMIGSPTPCVECGGQGYIDFVRIPMWILEQSKIKKIPNERLWADILCVYSSSCRCGSCKNWKRRVAREVSRWTRRELVEMGCKPLPIGDIAGSCWRDWPKIFEKLTWDGHWKPDCTPNWAKAKAKFDGKKDVDALAERVTQRMPGEDDQMEIPF